MSRTRAVSGAIRFDIAPADGAFCALFARLHGMCFANGWREDAFVDLMAMPGAFALLVSRAGLENSPPIGFALARVGGGECEIITLGVVPEQRGSGAATTLMRAITARAGELGAGDMLLEVAEDNPAAIALYQSAAFAPVGRRKNYYRAPDGAGVDAIVMRRTLLP
jgi:[ribosomal protein S18]-alanine N-acetyltransferase